MRKRNRGKKRKTSNIKGKQIAHKLNKKFQQDGICHTNSVY